MTYRNKKHVITLTTVRPHTLSTKSNHKANCFMNHASKRRYLPRQNQNQHIFERIVQ